MEMASALLLDDDGETTIVAEVFVTNVHDVTE